MKLRTKENWAPHTRVLHVEQVLLRKNQTNSEPYGRQSPNIKKEPTWSLSSYITKHWFKTDRMQKYNAKFM